MKQDQSMTSIPIEIELSEGAELPHYASSGAAGCDLRAYIKEPITLEPGASCLVPTGLKVAIPEGYEIQIRPRSGLALKEQITVLNTPGTIDCDYRGEVGVILINHGKRPFVVQPQMRIAQMVLAPVCRAEFKHAPSLASTERGSGSFGHTGFH